MIQRFLFSPLAWATLLLGICAGGCERGEKGGDSFFYGDSTIQEPEDEDASDPAETNPFVGTWKLTSNVDGSVWYAFFNADGSWRIADNPDGSQQRVYGSYSVSNGRLNGDMTNPNVGTGTITATATDGMMTLDFTEHWQTPYKTIRYTGERF